MGVLERTSHQPEPEITGAGKNNYYGYGEIDAFGGLLYLLGIDGIADTIETHNVFEALSHNDIGRYSIPSRLGNIDIVPSHLNIFK